MRNIANKQTVARLFGVHSATVMRWGRENRFPAPFTLVPRGRVFFDLDEIDAHLAARKHECTRSDSGEVVR
jgi:predicted DNA-binding transcriptional regulator AlpA